MDEKDFAKMSEEELWEYCKELEETLSKAQWFLKNRIGARIEEAKYSQTEDN